MKPERYQWLAGIISAHAGRRVVGRTRLQKTVKLLQRLGCPTDYGFTIFFYGPYSEDIVAEVRLLEHFGMVKETPNTAKDGTQYYVLEADTSAILPEIEQFRRPLDLMQAADPVVLELAATYDAFREMGDDHPTALERLRLKKGGKCKGGNEESSLRLLTQLGLSAV